MKLDCYLSCFLTLVLVVSCTAELIITLPDGINVSYIALPQQFDGNQLTFEAMSGEIIMPNSSFSPQGRFVLVPDGTNGWTTEIELLQAMTLNPKAILVYSTNNLGDLMYWRSGRTTEEVTVPVLEITAANWTESLAQHLAANGGILNATISDAGENPWKIYYDSWFMPVWSATMGIFSLANLALAGVILYRLGLQSKNIGVACCWLETIGNLLRILWCIEPYANWMINTWPRRLQTVFFTSSVPPCLSTMLLLAFYWHQLISSKSLEVSNFISTKAKIPLLVLICLLACFEVVTSTLRVIGLQQPGWDFNAVYGLLVFNEVAYIIFVLGMAIYYTFVSVKVFKFIKGLNVLRSSDRLLKRVTIRSTASIGGMVLIVSGGVMSSILPFYNTPHGKGIAHYFVFFGLNVISFFQIMAFDPASNKNSSQGSKSKMTGSLNNSSSLKNSDSLSAHV